MIALVLFGCYLGTCLPRHYIVLHVDVIQATRIQWNDNPMTAGQQGDHAWFNDTTALGGVQRTWKRHEQQLRATSEYCIVKSLQTAGRFVFHGMCWSRAWNGNNKQTIHGIHASLSHKNLISEQSLRHNFTTCLQNHTAPAQIRSMNRTTACLVVMFGYSFR